LDISRKHREDAAKDALQTSAFRTASEAAVDDLRREQQLQHTQSLQALQHVYAEKLTAAEHRIAELMTQHVTTLSSVHESYQLQLAAAREELVNARKEMLDATAAAEVNGYSSALKSSEHRILALQQELEDAKRRAHDDVRALQADLAAVISKASNSAEEERIAHWGTLSQVKNDMGIQNNDEITTLRQELAAAQSKLSEAMATHTIQVTDLHKQLGDQALQLATATEEARKDATAKLMAVELENARTLARVEIRQTDELGLQSLFEG
jgi:hypothetical protein